MDSTGTTTATAAISAVDLPAYARYRKARRAMALIGDLRRDQRMPTDAELESLYDAAVDAAAASARTHDLCRLFGSVYRDELRA